MSLLYIYNFHMSIAYVYNSSTIFFSSKWYDYAQKRGWWYMPRGKRIVSVEDRIQSTCVEIESLQEKIRSKKEELKSLRAEKEKSDAARIIAAVQESGKSVDEVLTLLSPTETSWKTKASSYKEEAIFLSALEIDWNE